LGVPSVIAGSANYWEPRSSDTKVSCMDRAIRPNEVEILNSLLDHALIDVTVYRLHPVEELRVVKECGCGCASLYFNPTLGNLQRIADELAVYPDGQRAGLMLWGRDGAIVLLEVYDFEPGSSQRVPDVSNLCTWEELGRKDSERANREQGKA
jgi:hypothetical protein